ncbi:NAD-dependent epimerase/dehydratase family domain protein [Burkholderia thailandensis]|uniref:NAD-dependent epimerase/dehydratase family domain protein n=1 Tax=Burkholderia thailandensis TaxID=57975 RepID=A0AAW9CRH9_BURTH|nr:NAD-dependent epimerase/dehydratase family domain protein [Burkholderia thailandensis]MDW9251224.1 NAD-dependent epimerase/dehydratase family domain protein [Burkholderia thailandensis]
MEMERRLRDAAEAGARVLIVRAGVVRQWARLPDVAQAMVELLARRARPRTAHAAGSGGRNDTRRARLPARPRAAPSVR